MEEVLDPAIEIELSQAKKINKKAKAISKAIDAAVDDNIILNAYNSVPQNKDIGDAYQYLSFLDNYFPESKLNSPVYGDRLHYVAGTSRKTASKVLQNSNPATYILNSSTNPLVLKIKKEHIHYYI